MNVQHWERIERVLDLALDSDPVRWSAIVDEACGGDAALRRDVEELLAEFSRVPGILGLAGSIAAEFNHDGDEQSTVDLLLGTQLGAWQVVRQIGRGGMSRVYLAERNDGAFAQRVAVKVLRAGLDTSADVARFRSERQILALLDHPNIARLLDGGVVADGRPYLVLEYIEGEPLTSYCNARKLDVAERLRLFVSVADATQSAHRQLVVHRDLKPSNILVGADGRPRLLDFGVAKILDPTSETRDGVTLTRRRWMTPDFAAPEQFTGAPVTTATDVWQLGVVLYELLTGHRPFEAAARPVEERVLRDDPPAPSSHNVSLRGDLDAIILKTLRKEPTARYASVADLSSDLQRSLRGAPVEARAGNRAYRWRRYARKHALGLSLGAAVATTVAAYAATLAVQNRRIATALTVATTEREKSDQIRRFLLGLFEANDPRSGRSDTISARSLMERGEATANALQSQPEVQAEMLEVIGRVRTDLGAFDAARPSLERALAIRRRVLGEAHPDVAQSIAMVARLDQTVGNYQDAARGFRDALTRQRAALGDTAPATQQSLFELGYVLHAVGKPDEARPFLSEWERRIAARPPRRDAEYASQLEALGQYVELSAKGDSATLDRAERHFREALAIRRDLFGANHALTALARQSLASLIWRRGRMREAEPLYREAATTLRSVYPSGSAALAGALMVFGNRLVGQQRFDEGVPMLHEAVEMARRTLGDDHLTVTIYLDAYGNALRQRGDYASAVSTLRDVEARHRRQTGETHIMVSRARLSLGDALRGLGRMKEAETLLTTTYARLKEQRGVQDPQTQSALRFLVRFYEQAAKPNVAAEYRVLLTPSARR